MIFVLLAYLLFQIAFDHWGSNAVHWQVIYFAVQYSFAGTVALVQWSKTRQISYMLIAIIFLAIAANELTYLQVTADIYQKMSSQPPAFALTIGAIVFFIIFEVIKWKRECKFRERN